MSEELISKKEILDITGISYGQLYRWKRKDLIPEDWFIKKSSYTGQETFFPKEKIMERINKILELKDEIPLDDLAEVFSNKPKVKNVDENYLVERGMIRSEILPLYKGLFEGKENYSFKEVLLMHVLQSQLDLGSATIEEIESMLRIMDREYSKLESKNGTVYLIRRLGIGICLAAFEEKIILDGNSKIIGEVNLKDTIDAVKFKLAL